MASIPDITISFDPAAIKAIDTLAAAMVAIKVNDDAVRSMREVEKRMRDAEADAERYRWIRDADRSDANGNEWTLYAMESLDEYIDDAIRNKG